MPLRTPVLRHALRASLRVALSLVALATAAASASAQPSPARLVASDIPNFYRAVDLARDGDSTALAAALRDEYLKKGSPGLHRFVLIRLGAATARNAFAKLGWDEQRARAAVNAPVGSADRATFDSAVVAPAMETASRNLARHYLARRAYYDAVRPNLMAIDTAAGVRREIEAALAKMRELYPEATSSDIYFVVGRLATGGTVYGRDLLIGAEMYGRDAATPVAELNDWERAVTTQAKELPVIVAHEYAHTLQGSRDGPRTLLSAALAEGSADLLAELATGAHLTNPAYAYGDAHEAELWAEFSAAMDSSDTSRWLYAGDGSKDRPADLGYWMGYRIARAYYDRAADKRAAVREILRFRDARKFLEESGYSGKR